MVASYVFTGLLGLSIGSFLSVVAYRLPRGESVIGGRSACPCCGSRIAGYDNIPVVSWLLLRGRCRSCGEAISPRYPLIEAATAALFVGVAVHFWDDPELVALGWLFAATLAAVTLTDLEHRIIPNRVLAASSVGWAAVAIPFAPDTVVESLISAAAAGGFLFVVALAYPKGMGMGDVKLVAVMGLYLGSSVAVGLLAGLLAGSVVGAAMIARQGAGARKRAIPFGPFLALGAVIALFAGAEIVNWYTDSFFGG